METWQTMTRWQIKTWRGDNIKHPIVKQCKHDCKLCALNCAWKQVTEHAKCNPNGVAGMHWTAEKLVGAPGQWEIIFHDRQKLGDLPVRHGH